MAEFDILPNDIKLQILSCINIQELDMDFLSVSKKWNNLVLKILINYYTSCSKQDFNAAFAISIIQDNRRLFSILKYIAEVEKPKIVIKAHLFVKEPEYKHNLLCKTEVPEAHERQRGFYFYEQASDKKIYVLVVHSENINEILCVTDLSQALNRLDLLEYVKLLIAEEGKVSDYHKNKVLNLMIKGNCTYHCESCFNKHDVISIFAALYNFKGQSLLYYAVKKGDFVLVNYLLDCIEKYVKSKNTSIETSDTIEISSKRQKLLQKSDISVQEKETIFANYVNIGYNKYWDVDISPLTALLLNFSLNNKEMSILAKRLYRLGATVSKGNYAGKKELENLLEAEMELCNSLHEEDKERLKQEIMEIKQENDRLNQDLEKTKYELACAKEKMQRFENRSISDEDLLITPQTRKRKRDSDDALILTQFNNLAQGLNIVVADPFERLDIAEDNSPAVTHLFKS